MALVTRRRSAKLLAAVLAAVGTGTVPTYGVDRFWVGSGPPSPGDDWGTATNWQDAAMAAGVPGLADTAIFDTSSGTIVVGGTAVAPRAFDTLSLRLPGAATDLTLGATGSPGFMRFKNLDTTGAGAARVFTINSQVTSSGTAGSPGAWTISSGNVVLTNSANNLANTTINVATGGQLTATGSGTVGGPSAITGAVINLSGGMFTTAAGLTLTSGFLRDQVYFRNPNGGATGSALIEASGPSATTGIFVAGGTEPTGFKYSLGGVTPNFSRNINVPITYDNARVTDTNSNGNSGAYSTNAFVAANGSHNNILSLTYGKINFTTAGDYTFGTRSDDGSNLFIDLDGNGDFDGAGEKVVANNRDQGYNNATGTVTIPTAGSYHIAFGWYQGGCCDNNGAEARYGVGAGIAFNSLTVINPSAPIAGTSFSGLVAGLADYTGSTVNVTENSTINGADAASFGTVVVTDGKRLDVNGGTTVTIALLKSSGGAGVVEIGGNGKPTLAAANAIDSSVKVLNKSGAGTLTISASQNYTGPINLSAGVFQLDAAMSSHGAIAITGGTFNANAAVNPAATISMSGGTYNATAANSISNTMNVAGTLNVGNANIGGGTINVKVAGTLNFNPGAGNTGTFTGTSVNVEAGMVRVSNGIGNMSGANLTAAPAATPFFSATFTGKLYELISPGEIHTDLAAFQTNNPTPTNTANLTTSSTPNRLRFASDGEIGAFFGNNTVAANGGNGQWTSTFEGTFTPRVAGNHFFGVEVNDDNTSIYVDLNRDNTFDQATEMITQQNCCNQNNGATVNLVTANVAYKFLIANRDTGGGGSMSMTVAEPGGGRFFAAPGFAPSGGTIQVDAGAELRANTVNNFTSIQLNGTTTAGSGGKLTLGAGTVPSPLSSTADAINVTTQGAVDIGANHTLTVQNLNIGTGTFTKAGAGTLKVSGTTVTLNQSNLVLSGGTTDLSATTINYTPLTFLTGAGLAQRWMDTDGVNRDENFVNTPTAFLGFIPKGTSIRKGPLSFADLNAFNTAATTAVNVDNAAPTSGVSGVRASGDDFAFVWNGKFKPTVGGQFTFSVGRATAGVDDEQAIFIDINNDGVFSANERFGSTVGVGCCNPGTEDIATLTANTTYNVAMVFHEFGGGERGSADFRIVGDPTFDAYRAINPNDAAQAGWWTYSLGVGGGTTQVASGATLLLGAVNGAMPLTLGSTGNATAGTVAFSAKASLTTTVMGAISVVSGSSGVLDVRTNNIVSTSGVDIPSGSTLTKTGAGTLLITGATGTGTGTLSVTGGRLGGTGSIAGPLSIASGGTLAPGASIGTLGSGSLTMAPGSTFEAELDPAASGQKADLLNVIGSVNLTGATLALLVGSTPTNGQTFLLISNDASDPVVGSFANPIVTVGAFIYTVNTAGGDGNDVVVTASPVPEPAAVGLLGFAALGLLARRRRRFGGSI